MSVYHWPVVEFLQRHGAWLVLLFILVHKIGDTLANLTFRLLFNDLGFSNDEIALYDVGVGFWAYLIGIFIGGIAYTRMGLKHSVMLALVLMCVESGFAVLAAMPQKSRIGRRDRHRDLASGYGGFVVVAYFSHCAIAYTATQYALISGGNSIVGGCSQANGRRTYRIMGSSRSMS